MGLNQNHRRFLPGDPLLARDFAQISATCDWASRISVTPPLTLTSLSGPIIGLAAVFGAQLAYTASGGITARSGATAGFGNVYLVTASVSGTTATLTNASNTTVVFNFSATTGGIPGGKYCWVEQDPSGNWWLVSVEC